VRIAACTLMAAAFVLGGCGPAENRRASASATHNPNEKRYPLTGEILRADVENRVVIVTPDEIRGYMPAMTMEFKVSHGDALNAKAGQRIRAELVERPGAGGDPEYFLERIWPDDAVVVRALDAATKALAQDTATRGRGVYREVGESAPDFTLLDQEGRAVSANRFRGKKVMMNFIFTRCPVATMCPAATQKMAELQDAAKKAGVENVEFVSITLDPEYDTPGVLKDYADARGLNLSNWSFLTGPDAAVRHLLAQMGIIREFEGATIKHNLATLLIDPNGRIVHRVDGSRWDTEEFLPRLQR
jgi:protein SCO1